MSRSPHGDSLEESPPRFHLALGSDHAGLALKDHLVERLRAAGHTVEDLGTHTRESCDYPEFAGHVARAVAREQVDRGILVCGTGQGMAMSANRVAGVRAAVVLDTFSARASRQHNASNVLCLGSRVCGDELAWELVTSWLDARFEGGRHERRIRQMGALRGAGAETEGDASPGLASGE